MVQSAAAGDAERRYQHFVVLVLPEIRWIDQVLPGNQLEPIQDRLVPRGIAQAVLGNMQVHRPDMGRIEMTVFDRRLPRIFGNGDQHRGAPRRIDKGAVALRHVGLGKELRIGFILQIVDDETVGTPSSK